MPRGIADLLESKPRPSTKSQRQRTAIDEGQKMNRFFREGEAQWAHLQDLPNFAFVCGFCDTKVSSVKGYKLGHNRDGSGAQIGGVYVCPNCGGPVFRSSSGEHFPSPAFGNPVQHVPGALNSLFEEARRCSSQSCYTAAVLLCRKMLMNIAVEKGAKEGLKFIDYVGFLSDKGYVPPDGKGWVDHIRNRGNEATHEIALMEEQDAKDLIVFTMMLLRFVYELPRMIPKQP